MPRKKDINYEVLLVESCLDDFKRQEKLLKDMRGSKLLTEEGRKLLDLISAAHNNWEALNIDNFMNYATTITNDAKTNSEYISLMSEIGLNLMQDGDFDKYFDIVKKQVKEEKLKSILQSVNIDVKNGNVDEAIRKLNLESVRESMNMSKEKTREEKLVDFMLSIDKDYGEDGTDNGFTTGVKILDDAFGKIKRGELFVLGGASGAGKSLLCNNIFAKLVAEERNVIYLSLEMPFNSVFSRTASIMKGTQPRFYRGTFDSREAILQQTQMNQEFVEKMNMLNNWEIISIADLPEGKATVENILEKCLLIQKERKWEKIDCVIFDYLQFVEKSNAMDGEYEKINNAVNKIKGFIVKEDLPLILITSLNANGELKGSTNILYTSDFSATIDNDARSKEIKHLKIIKSRYTPPRGGCKIIYDNFLRVVEKETE